MVVLTWTDGLTSVSETDHLKTSSHSSPPEAAPFGLSRIPCSDFLVLHLALVILQPCCQCSHEIKEWDQMYTVSINSI